MEMTRRGFLEKSGQAAGFALFGDTLKRLSQLFGKTPEASPLESEEGKWIASILSGIIPENARERFINSQKNAEKPVKTSTGILYYGTERPIADATKFQEIFRSIDMMKLGLPFLTEKTLDEKITAGQITVGEARKWMQHLRERLLPKTYERSMMIMVAKSTYDGTAQAAGFRSFEEYMIHHFELFNELVARDTGIPMNLRLGAVVVLDDALYPPSSETDERLAPKRDPNKDYWHSFPIFPARVPFSVDGEWALDPNYLRLVRGEGGMFQPTTEDGKKIDVGQIHDLLHLFGDLGDLYYYYTPGTFDTSSLAGNMQVVAFSDDIMADPRAMKLTAVSAEIMKQQVKNKRLRSTVTSDVEKRLLPRQLSIRLASPSTEIGYVRGLTSTSQFKEYPFDDLGVTPQGQLASFSESQLDQAFPFIVLGIKRNHDEQDQRQMYPLPVPRYIADMMTYFMDRNVEISLQVTDALWSPQPNFEGVKVVSKTRKEVEDLFLSAESNKILAWCEVPQTRGVCFVWQRIKENELPGKAPFKE